MIEQEGDDMICLTPRDAFNYDTASQEAIERLTVLHQSVLDNQPLLRDLTVQKLFVNQGFPILRSCPEKDSRGEGVTTMVMAADFEECKLVADCLWTLACISEESTLVNSTTTSSSHAITTTTSTMEHLASLISTLPLSIDTTDDNDTKSISSSGNQEKDSGLNLFIISSSLIHFPPFVASYQALFHKWGCISGLVAKQILRNNDSSTTLTAEFTHAVFGTLIVNNGFPKVVADLDSHSRGSEWASTWGYFMQGYLDGFGEGKGSCVLSTLILKLGIFENGIDWGLVAALVRQSWHDGFLWTRSEGLFWELVDELVAMFVDTLGPSFASRGGLVGASQEIVKHVHAFAVVFVTHIAAADQGKVRESCLQRIVTAVLPVPESSDAVVQAAHGQMQSDFSQSVAVALE